MVSKNIHRHNLLIEWKQAYELGIPILDEQHRGFVSSINTIHYFLTYSRDFDIIEHTLEVLKIFFDIHLITEEDIMFRLDYPLYSQHVEQHKQILRDLDVMAHSLRSKGDTRDILLFIRDYWNDHVLYYDHKFARWLEKEAIIG